MKLSRIVLDVRMKDEFVGAPAVELRTFVEHAGGSRQVSARQYFLSPDPFGAEFDRVVLMMTEQVKEIVKREGLQ